MAQQREFPFSMQDFNFLASTVYEQTGIVLKEQKYEMLYARLARRLRRLGFNKFEQYVELLKGPQRQEEINFLVDAVTTNLTRFFREDYQLKHFINVLDARGTSDEPVRIWSAGCSSGQEPYSIAMALHAWSRNRLGFSARILATDIDRNVLTKGRAGIYLDREVEDIPANFRDRYLTARPDGKYAISETLKSMITFNNLNLLGPWPMRQKFDAIYCRNVMIYFDDETKEVLVGRFRDMLSDNGILFVGHSESLAGAINGLEPCGRAAFRRAGAV